MSEKQPQLEQDMQLCSNGCGFFGSSTTNFLCSKCFKDSLNRTTQPSMTLDAKAHASKPAVAAPSASAPTSEPLSPIDASAAPAPAPSEAAQPAAAEPSASVGAAEEAGVAVPAQCDVPPSAPAAAAAESPAEPPAPAAPLQKNRNRCFKCNKKVGLTGLECKCSLVFCSMHRYPEAHECNFDFQADARRNLERTVVGGGAFSKVDHL